MQCDKCYSSETPREFGNHGETWPRQATSLPGACDSTAANIEDMRIPWKSSG